MTVTRPRGPLPARVYWTRRLLVLGLALVLVFGIGKLLGAGGTSDSAARPASAVGSTSADAAPSGTATADATTEARSSSGKPRAAVPLAMPTGPCLDSDVRVRPRLTEEARAGGDVRLTLRLSTYESPACTWEVSADTVAVKLTSGDDRIWSSQDCPRAVPETAVVLRQRAPEHVDVTWSGRRSDADCSNLAGWAEPGYYHVAAAALGSEPESQQFQLLGPATIVITQTPTPTPEADPKQPRTGRDRDGGDTQD